VWRITGKPLSSLQGATKQNLPFKLKAFALVPSDREALHRKIEQRFDAMLEAGLVQELEDLKRKYELTAGMPSMRCVGYRQAWELLEGKISVAQMRDRALAATRQLAKRQMTWLRSFPDLIRLDAGGPKDAPAALARLLRELR
jgi:tRNA dimethylallyltransferase